MNSRTKRLAWWLLGVFQLLLAAGVLFAAATVPYWCKDALNALDRYQARSRVDAQPIRKPVAADADGEANLQTPLLPPPNRPAR